MLDTLLLFGATGDLAGRYLFPSLLHLLRDRLLPEEFRIAAIGRSEHDDAGFGQWLRGRLSDERDIALLPELLKRTHYHALDLADPDAVAAALSRYADRPAVSYLSTPPNLFEAACMGLGGAGLLEPPSRLVLEKPIGHDLDSARAIDATLKSSLEESRIFRIDHYLGKAPVQNLLALRFGNTLLEAVWHNRWIESVDILVAETAGVDGREGYYAGYGALRDMVQNHALQLLTMIAMEPPPTHDADAIRDEKLKVLKSLKAFTAESVARDVVRGQYRAGTVDGKAASGYLDEAKVPADSTTETFVALRTEVQNWRWAGVPFFLRTGKRLAARHAQIVVNFRPVPHPIFPGSTRANKLVIKLQPEDGLELHLLAAKGAGQGDWLAPVFLDLDFDKAFAAERVGAYERLLLDAIAGRLNLFVRSDEQEQAWRWIEPVLQAWADDPSPPRPYAAGTWGPPAASAMIARDGCVWDEEQ